MLKKALNYFPYCLGGIFLIAIFASGVAGIGYLFEIKDIWWLSEPLSVAFTISLVTLLFIIMMYLYILFLRLIYKNRSIFGESPYSILISLGITCAFFPRPVLKVLNFPIDYFSGSLWLIQDILKLPSFLINSSTTEITKEVWLAQAEKFFSTFFRAFSESISSTIRTLPFTDILIAIAVWAAIGWVFNAFAKTRDEESRLKVLLIQNLKTIGFNRILLTVFILAASYLSITSIIAIPWLMEIKVSDVTENNNMLSMLKENGSAQEIFDKTYPQNLGNNVESALVEMETTLNQFDTIKIPAQCDPLLREEMGHFKSNYIAAIGIIRDNRVGIINKWESLRSSVWAQEQRLLKKAQTVFITETTIPMGIQEKQLYFNSIQNWLGYTMDAFTSKMTSTMGIVNELDLQMANRIHTETVSLKNIHNLIIEVKGDSSRTVSAINRLRYNNSEELLNITLELNSSINSFTMPVSYDESPTPPKPGQELGIFGLLSSWLLKARSFELTLIVGMFGFGLLGACLSFFINTQKIPDGNKPEFKISGALIKGMSAAIVIFLSVKGGLMVLAVEKTQPNAYILFFACLIGAVFSSNVWDWARKTFLQKYLNENLENVKTDSATQDKKPA